jgi:hypothetical protein
MDDRSRLTYLTRHYYELQGIRTAPVWLTLLVCETDSLGIAKFDGFGAEIDGPALHFFATLLWIGLMAYFSWLAGRYYHRRFGWLTPEWIAFPTSRVYWSLYIGCFVWCIYCIVFSGFRGELPYVFTIVWISPLFKAENPPLRRIYFALAGALVVSSTLFIQLTQRNNALIIVIQCIALVALGIADHLLLMSLCTPPREDADA